MWRRTFRLPLKRGARSPLGVLASSPIDPLARFPSSPLVPPLVAAPWLARRTSHFAGTGSEFQRLLGNRFLSRLSPGDSLCHLSLSLSLRASAITAPWKSLSPVCPPRGRLARSAAPISATVFLNWYRRGGSCSGMSTFYRVRASWKFWELEFVTISGGFLFWTG